MGNPPDSNRFKPVRTMRKHTGWHRTEGIRHERPAFNKITHSTLRAYTIKKSIVKSFPEPLGPWGGGADLRFTGPQPDTSRSCKIMNTGPVCRTVRLFTPQLTLQYQLILLGDRGTCVCRQLAQCRTRQPSGWHLQSQVQRHIHTHIE